MSIHQVSAFRTGFAGLGFHARCAGVCLLVGVCSVGSTWTFYAETARFVWMCLLHGFAGLGLLG